MKKTLLLFLLLPVLSFAQVVDLASWSLTSNGGATSQSYVLAGTLAGPSQASDTPLSYNASGLLAQGWVDANFQHYKYFDISIAPKAGNVIMVSNLIFQQATISNGGNGPTNYSIRYYISENGSVPNTFDFYNNSFLLQGDQTIAGNPNKTIKVNQSLNANQRLIVRFYARGGNSWNNDVGWRILANTLKFTGNTMGPLKGPYKVGSASDADFATITAAANALNNVGVAGAVNFSLDNTLYNNTTGEIFPIKINTYTGGDTYKVTFRPNTGRTVTIESSTGFPQAIFKLDGADNVIFDGSNNSTTSNNLTISNNNTSNNNRSVIWIASQGASNGANNNEVRNLTLQQYFKGNNDYSVGVFAGNTDDVSSTAVAANSGNIVNNVTFNKVGQAISVNGSSNSSLLSLDWKIQNNTIGSTTNAEKPYVGINLLNLKDYVVSGNKIDGIYRTTNQTQHAGIYSEGSVNGNIFNNSISNVVNTLGDGAPQSRGIYLNGTGTNIYNNTVTNVSASAGTSSSGFYINGGNNTIYNNIISNIYFTNSDNTSPVHGIYLNSGDANKIYFNTIAMNNSTNVSGSSCLYINAGTNLGIKNNIFYNSQTKATQFLINSAVAHSAITEFDYNNYYGTNSAVKIGKISGNEYATIDLWKDALKTTKETNSLNNQPNFISVNVPTDFHLVQNNTNAGIHAKGIAISTITTDIDGDPRATPPDMGADEIFYCEQGDKITYGDNSWIGYVYKWTGTPAPTTYIGYVTENTIFDRNVGAGQVNGASRTICGAPPSDNFMVRYLMKTTTVEGTYNITVGGDDGYRLYIDGQLINSATNWGDHSYVTSSIQVKLSAGVHSFILEYYENVGSSRISFSYGLIKGDPSVFGINVWNVYGYNTPNFNLPAATYAGTYLDTKLDINTTNYWPKEKSPSSATTWEGAPMPIDNFTISYKRQGFPCGSYNIQVINCDDDMQIFIDEKPAVVYTAGGNINNPVLINSGAVYALNSASKVEIRLREDAGDAKMAVSFIDVPVTYNGSGTVPVNTSIIVKTNASLNSNIEVCSCTIDPGKTLTVPLDKVLTVKENITVGAAGKLLIENGGSLVQTNKNAIYTGANDSFELQRLTQAMRYYDFTYWSSPITLASGFTLKKLSPDTAPDMYQSYNPFTGWVSHMNGAASMIPGVGYIVRAPETSSATVGAVYPASFVGVPNNGDVNFTPVENKFNLIGNPYASPLDAAEFIKQNNGTITGSLYFWTHNSAPANTDPNKPNIYYYTSNDYAVFNLTGSVATGYTATSTEAPSDKSSADNAPTGKIASGQGFFVKALTNTPLKFTNEMRKVANNTQFFKTKSSNTEEGRLWLNFTNSQGAFKQVLVGYIDEATNNFENNYDAQTFNGNAYVDFYSINDNKKLAIQGRALPFDIIDQVPLGYKSTIAGYFTISIDRAEGLLKDQPVFVEDKNTKVIHDLRTSDYTFTTEIGTFTDRFVLRYKTDKTLGTGDFENLENGILLSVKNKVINIVSSKENIKEVTVFDILGKMLYSKKKVGNTELQIQNLQSGNQVLLVKITLENDFTVSKKIILN
ncbi:hypothetical protein FLA105534_01515 [Flavobacterium bizetiae]|uniref:PA14 domain-containing protein n=1 Tax=Flavobacterium bizetiae TaxID=2704140 RepID=A0A6J4GGR5_9FLAO|nr:T9SS sorting signal type C domain-containing protein [Flavobacterium bizetiae]CAA9197187.1 hypothetical protein FLA105534_01515 [Flavobacterium bizetiae]CAD5342875.1 hypothetical protein FLA105535_02872 [Flavobacterium bizetiae]CAD5349298.1 hypothetical protein FLA105534_03282 [Flavobacterium bizetiae]